MVLGQGRHDLRVTDDEGWVDTLVFNVLADQLRVSVEVFPTDTGRVKRCLPTLSSRRALVLGSLQSTLC